MRAVKATWALLYLSLTPERRAEMVSGRHIPLKEFEGYGNEEKDDQEKGC